MQKKEELVYIDIFKKLYPYFPEGEIIEFESPDFLIKNKHKTIGIELSKIYQKDCSTKLSLQTKDSFKDDIINRIRTLLIENKIINYEVHIFFSIHHQLIKKERIAIAHKIFTIIKNNLSETYNHTRIENDFEDLENFPEQLSSLSIINLPQLDKPIVTNSRFGWVQEEMINELSNVISKKNDKIHLYKKNCHELWLIIYTNSMGSGSFFEPNEKSTNYEYSSSFNKVFFLNSFNAKIYELKIANGNDYDK